MQPPHTPDEWRAKLAAAQLRVDLGGQEATVPVDREFALSVAAGNIVSLTVSKANVFVHPN